MEDAGPDLKPPPGRCLQLQTDSLGPLVPAGSLLVIHPVPLQRGGWAWSLRWCCAKRNIQGAGMLPAETSFALPGKDIPMEEFQQAAQLVRRAQAVPVPEPTRTYAKPRPDLNIKECPSAVWSCGPCGTWEMATHEGDVPPCPTCKRARMRVRPKPGYG